MVFRLLNVSIRGPSGARPATAFYFDADDRESGWEPA